MYDLRICALAQLIVLPHKFSSIQVITQTIIKAYIYFTITKTHETPTTMGKWHRYVQCQAGTPYFLVFVTLLKRTLFHTKSVSTPPHVVGGGWVKETCVHTVPSLPLPDTNTTSHTNVPHLFHPIVAHILLTNIARGSLAHISHTQLCHNCSTQLWHIFRNPREQPNKLMMLVPAGLLEYYGSRK